MLEAFRGSDNPPAVATRTGCIPAAALFDGRSLHGYDYTRSVPLGTVSRSRFALLSSMSLSFSFLLGQ